MVLRSDLVTANPAAANRPLQVPPLLVEPDESKSGNIWPDKVVYISLGGSE